jgi:phosphatidylglycerophosphatase C
MAEDAPPRRVAAFDFDGTMVPGDSLIPFLWRTAGAARFARAVLRHGLRIAVATGLGLGSRDAAKEAFVRATLGGRSLADVRTAGEAFAADLERRVDPDALARVAWHRDRGHELVLVSASLELYLAPLGERLGVDAVLATRLVVDADDRVTGSLDGPNVRGPEKVVRLRDWLGRERCELWAYGDSDGDRELLALADHGFRVPRGGFAGLGLA